MSFRKIIITALVVCFSASPGADAAATTAGEWQADCRAYIGVLSGTGDGDDLEITYCMGLTLGIVGGLETGSRIGALSMASLLALLLSLDRDSVFRIFNEVSKEDLLGYCLPADQSGSRTISVVSDYLARHPDKAGLPATAVFFDALQEAYPCDQPSSDEGQPPAEGEKGS